MKRTVVMLGAWLVAWAPVTARAQTVAPEPEPSESPAAEAVEQAADTVGEAAETVGEETKEAALNFGEDMWNMPSRLWQDIQGLPHWNNAAALTIGGGLAALSHEEWDSKVAANTEAHPERFGGTWNDVLDVLANGYTLYGISAAFYGSSLFVESRRLHDFSLDLLSAYTLEMPLVFGLKRAFDTERPNGENHGFPSGHAAASATLGALLNRHYGPYAGLGGAAFAALVAFHRVDARNHDVSDVIFGAAIGYVFGRTAGDVEEVPVLKAHLAPLRSSTGAPGFQLEWQF
jgi:hypothetical protein